MKADERRRLGREVEYKLRHARIATKDAAKARTSVREHMNKLARYEWDSVYYRDTRPGMAEQLERNGPRLRNTIDRMVELTADLDATAATLYRQAREAQAKLDRPTWQDIGARIRESFWPFEILHAVHSGRRKANG